MAGISSKAIAFGQPENKKKYNGIEQNNDFDLNMYDAFYRNLDPQIGRFWQIDPQADILESYSPYESMGNNPISNVDPLGDFKTRFGAWLHSLFNGGDVGENIYGEWYVSKTNSSSSDDGSVTVEAHVTYGKGRYKDKAAREEWAAEQERQDRRQALVDLGVYERVSSVDEVRENTLTLSAGVLLPTFIKFATPVASSANAVKQETSIVSKIIHTGKQGKHIVGHNNYQVGKSILTEDAQALLDAFHSGNVKSVQTINDVKTRVDFGKVIGTYINPETKEAVSTTRGIIVNSKSGAHIIPSSPN